MPFKRGDVLLAHYPFTDQSASTLRPVLVVSGKKYNKGGDYVVLPISSTVRSGDQFAFVIQDTDTCFAQSGLRMTSAVKWTKVMTIADTVIARHLGSLPAGVVNKIVTSLRSVFEA